MEVLKRHIRVGVYKTHSGNWGATSFQRSMKEATGRGERWSWGNTLEPVLGPSTWSGPSVAEQDCSFHPLNRNQMKIVRQQKLGTREFLLPFIPHPWQWLRYFLKVRLNRRNCSCCERIGGFIDAMITLRLLPSALVARNSGLFVMFI